MENVFKRTETRNRAGLAVSLHQGQHTGTSYLYMSLGRSETKVVKALAGPHVKRWVGELETGQTRGLFGKRCFLSSRGKVLMPVPVSRLKAPMTSNLQLNVQDGMFHNSIQTTPQPSHLFIIQSN